MAIKLKILMILPFPRYEEKMRVPPQVGICSYLKNLGHDVDWMIWSDYYTSQQISHNDVNIFITHDYNIFSSKYFILKILNRIPGILFRIIAAIKISKNNGYNLILVRNDVFDGLIGLYIKLKYNKKFLFMISNPLEQELEYLKIAPIKPYFLYYLLFNFNYFVASRLLNEADLVMPISKWLAEHLVVLGIPVEKILPITEGIDIEAFHKNSTKDISNKYNLNGSRVIIYIGTLGKARQLEILIRAFSKVQQKRHDVTLLIVGEGDGKGDLQKNCHMLGIDRSVLFIGQVPQDEVPSFIMASDIGISPIPPISFYKMSSPIKMFEYMALAKPVIANKEIPEHEDVLKCSGGGILVSYSHESFADAIIHLLDNPKRACELGQKGQDWVLKNRTYDLMAQKLETDLLNLFKNSS